MPRTGLNPEEMRTAILDAAEALIRRHGIDRTRLVDIAKSIGVHHAVLYRSFTDKAALIDAVSERHLARIRTRLAEAATAKVPVMRRLKNWFVTLYRQMRDWRAADPELYRCYRLAAEAGREVAGHHVAQVRWQLAKLVTEAIRDGEMAPADPLEVTVLLFDATTIFHDPIGDDPARGIPEMNRRRTGRTRRRVLKGLSTS